MIAAHFIRAGAAAEAIAHVRRAVELAARRLASGDVIARCRTGLALLAALPDGPGRDEHEVGFLVPLGVALLAGPGIVDDDVAVYERARELHRRLGRADDPSTLRVLANALIPRRRFEAARQIGEALLARADEDELLATEGHYLVGATSFWLGELERSRGHLELALTSYQPARRHEHLRRFAQDPGAVCLCRLALTDAHLGHGALARGLTAQAIAAAGSGGHPYTEIYVGFFGGWALAEVGDIGAGAALALASKAAPDNLFGRVSQALFTAWAQLARGDYAAAVATFDTAIGLMGHHLSMNEPLALVLQADSHRRAGNPAAGIPLAARAVEIATTEMPIHLAEAHRLLGELELAVGRRDDGLGHLTYAAATAQAQHNVLHGARAHLAIARATNDLDRRAWAAARHDFDAWRRRHAKGCDLAELDEAAALFAHSTTTERP